MGGGIEPQRLRQHQPQHHARLGILGQDLLGRAVYQGVEIGQPAQGLARNRLGERTVGRLADVRQGRALGLLQRLAPPEHGIEQAERSAAHGKSGRKGHRPALEHRAKKWEPVFRIKRCDHQGTRLETKRQHAH